MCGRRARGLGRREESGRVRRHVLLHLHAALLEDSDRLGELAARPHLRCESAGCVAKERASCVQTARGARVASHQLLELWLDDARADERVGVRLVVTGRAEEAGERLGRAERDRVPPPVAVCRLEEVDARRRQVLVEGHRRLVGGGRGHRAGGGAGGAVGLVVGRAGRLVVRPIAHCRKLVRDRITPSAAGRTVGRGRRRRGGRAGGTGVPCGRLRSRWPGRDGGDAAVRRSHVHNTIVRLRFRRRLRAAHNAADADSHVHGHLVVIGVGVGGVTFEEVREPRRRGLGVLVLAHKRR